MGPYCKFCGNRCFVPTNKEDYVKTDLKATCKDGIVFDLNKTFPSIISKSGKVVGWMIDFNRHEEYSIGLEFINDKLMEFEIKTSDILEERIDLIYGNHSYIVK